MCDASVSWVGWYRLYLNDQSTRMAESCVAVNRCGTDIPLWLSGGHPKPEDGVVTRDVCGHSYSFCCFFQSNPIRVKACTGGYYVYELVTPTVCNRAYCADDLSSDPCSNYLVLDDPRRSTSYPNTSLFDASDDQQRDLLNVFVIVGLAFTSLALLTFAFCRWKPGVNNVARINLCISLLSAHLLFLLTQQFINLIKPYKELCAVISGVLHFFFLSYFVWMFIEAVLLFICVKNLSQISSRWRAMLSSRFLIVIGYVIPFIIVRVSVGLVSEGYGSEQCWIKVERGFIWSFLGPVCFILAINTILFISIIISLHLTLKKLNTEVSHMRQTKITVFKTLAQFVIFGCPWILGPFIDSKVVKILFLILNSQQGTFIFLVYCVLNNEVRQQYVKWLRNLFSGLKPRTIKSGSNNTAD
nr:adhesion G protein-coupled receptor E1-like [Misgurnus anguillicaudatus]